MENLILPANGLTGKEIGQIVTLRNKSVTEKYYAGVACYKDGTVKLWNEGDPLPDRTSRTNSNHHDIKGLEEGELIFQDKTLVTFDRWYDWDFHDFGLLLCYQDRLDIVILCGLTPPYETPPLENQVY